MAKIRIINPETAAHNIAEIFSKEYVKNLNDTNILSAEYPDFFDAVKETAEFYANTYDEAYDFFSKENDKEN